MTLEEAIKHGYKESLNEENCIECRLEHVQLYDWLNELSNLKRGDTTMINVEEIKSKEGIEIIFKNGEEAHYTPDEFTSYQYVDGGYFVVIRDKQWIGIYNMDAIVYVAIY